MFTLDPRLADSSFFIAELPLSQVRLKNNRLYPWLILIPRRVSLTELHELSLEEQYVLIQEITQVSKGMKTYFKAHKMNSGALGNIVSQLHIHVIARSPNDPSWPHSVWQPNVKEEPYDSVRAQEIMVDLKRLFLI